MSVMIHGNEYITVAERLEMVHKSGKSFEMAESVPLQIGERVLWRCVVKIDNQQFIGTAEAKLENARKGSPDASNPFECAETSALGRALGFAGFGAIENVCSADEITRSQPAPAAPAQQQPTQQQQRQPAPAPAKPAPAAKPAPKQDNPNAERLERLFQRGEATNMWAKRGEFLAYMSKVLAQPITRDNVGELDSSMLDVIEDAMLEPEHRGAA